MRINGTGTHEIRCFTAVPAFVAVMASSSRRDEVQPTEERGPLGRPSPGAGALDLVLDAAWPGRRAPDPPADLEVALSLARANQVQGALARRFPAALAQELAHVERATAAF